MPNKKMVITTGLHFMFILTLSACCIGKYKTMAIDFKVQQRYAAENIRRNRKNLAGNYLRGKNSGRNKRTTLRRELISSLSMVLHNEEINMDYPRDELMSFVSGLSLNPAFNNDAQEQNKPSQDGLQSENDEHETLSPSPSQHPTTYVPTIRQALNQSNQSSAFLDVNSSSTIPSKSPTTEQTIMQNSSSTTTTSTPINEKHTQSPSHYPTTRATTVYLSSSQPTTPLLVEPRTASPSHGATRSFRPETTKPSSRLQPTDRERTSSPSMHPTPNPSKTMISPSISIVFTTVPSRVLPTASQVSSKISAKPTPTPSEDEEVFSTHPTTVSLHPTLSPAMNSPIQSLPTYVPTTRSFSSKISIFLKGVTELMDDETSAKLEYATMTFLNKQFDGTMKISEVDLWNQSIDFYPDATKYRDLRVLNGRLIRTFSHTVDRGGRPLLRSLNENALLAEMGVYGSILNWTAFNATKNDDQINSVSISNTLTQSIASNYEEFMVVLSGESAFFSEKFPATPSAVVESESSTGANEPNLKIVVILGGVFAFVALVGSKFYVERRSATKRHHQCNDNSTDKSAYDLNRVTKSAEDCVDDDSHRRRRVDDEREMEEIATYDNGCLCLASKDLKSPKSSKVNARMTSLLDQVESCETEPPQNEVSALDMSPQCLKAAIKRKENNIYVFTETTQASSSKKNGKFGDDPCLIEIQHSVSSLSNPSHIEEPFTPSPRYGYLGDRFNHTNVEKMIGDQYDTRAIMTPFTPKGNGNGTPSRRTNYSFSSPTSTPRKIALNQDRVYYVYAPSGPLGTIIDTTPEGPMIHSLKPDSQLLGLVDPGDLIVGLDGVDTRNMTAATFTRLMAKRSQGERKITLLKGSAPVSTE